MGFHVGIRLVEAFQALRKLPVSQGPRMFGNGWPAYVYDWADQLAQQGSDEDQKKQTEIEQNRTRLLPSAEDIARMEHVIAWPARYLGSYPHLLRTVGICAIVRSQGRDLQHAARKLKWRFELTRLWNREGLDMIAAGLRRDQVQIF